MYEVVLRNKRIFVIIGAVALLILLAVALKTFRAYTQLKDPEPLVFWAQNNPLSNEIIDHNAWQLILDEYVIETESINAFDYDSVSDNHYSLLQDYIDGLQELDPTEFHPDEQMAYWLNLYNAVTVQVVLDDYPIDSIKDTGEGVLGLGPWEDDLVEIAGHSLTLNNIEHGILRRVWNDNRIHFGVNCASVGCPNLVKTAFTRANLKNSLDSAARAFINSDRGVKFVRKDGQDILILSSIFDWFSMDFGKDEDALLAFLQKYANPTLKPKLANYSGDIHYDYDWSLNDAGRLIGADNE